jgi:deoxyribodipyrimidine photo-lyase
MTPIPLTRHDALAAWAAFLPDLGDYAKRRNFVEPQHRNVSQLSAALRYRVLLEDEVIDDTLRTYDFRTVEKWLQEVCWRRYWKGWLELRPDVWSTWLRRVSELNETLPEAVMQRAHAVAAGESGVACMDAIARELITSGYLHNHARMWWASYWIHVERLPWELGAAMFFRHLIDADPASNTLSWRWVAGLQTAGKTYLVRKSNLEKYAPELLLHHPAGSDRIADGAVTPTVAGDFANTARQAVIDYPSAAPASDHRLGIWLHTDDLVPEVGPLAKLTPITIAGSCCEHSVHQRTAPSEQRIVALDAVLADGLARAAMHFQCPTVLLQEGDLAASLSTWATHHQLDEVVAFAPTVGPVADFLPQLRQQLTAAGVTLTLLRRPSDAQAFKLASAGFFPFWEKMSRHLNPQDHRSANR